MEDWTQIHWGTIICDILTFLLILSLIFYFLRRLFPTRTFLPLLPLLGIVLSSYALYIESSHLLPSYTGALCDIEIPILEIHASCTSTLTSPESHVLSYLGVVPPSSPLDVPNAFLGLLYYSAVLLVGYLPIPRTAKSTFMNAATTLALMMSVYLLRVLYVKGDVCLLCGTTHVINAALWVTRGRGGWIGEGGEEEVNKDKRKKE